MNQVLGLSSSGYLATSARAVVPPISAQAAAAAAIAGGTIGVAAVTLELAGETNNEGCFYPVGQQPQYSFIVEGRNLLDYEAELRTHFDICPTCHCQYYKGDNTQWECRKCVIWKEYTPSEKWKSYKKDQLG